MEIHILLILWEFDHVAGPKSILYSNRFDSNLCAIWTISCLIKQVSNSFKLSSEITSASYFPKRLQLFQKRILIFVAKIFLKYFPDENFVSHSLKLSEFPTFSALLSRNLKEISVSVLEPQWNWVSSRFRIHKQSNNNGREKTLCSKSGLKWRNLQFCHHVQDTLGLI